MSAPWSRKWTSKPSSSNASARVMWASSSSSSSAPRSVSRSSALRAARSGCHCRYHCSTKRPALSERTAATASAMRRRSRGTSRISSGIDRAGGAGRSLPPSGTSRVYSQPPIWANSRVSASSPNSANARRMARLRASARAERVIGVHGLGAWLASRSQNPGGTSTGTGSGSGAWSGRAVIGRAWSSTSSPPARAHSMSWGAPSWASTRRASAATSAATSASMAPSGAARHVAAAPRTIHSSGDAPPATSRSPRPRTAFTTVVSRSPVTGSALKATPAASAATIGCTSTAIATSRPTPRDCR